MAAHAPAGSLTAQATTEPSNAEVVGGTLAPPAREGGYAAAAVATVAAAPIAATAGTVAAYALVPAREFALSAGALTFLGSWLVLALLGRWAGLAAADRANTRSYGELRQRLEQLKARLRATPRPPAGHSAGLAAYEEATGLAAVLERELRGQGLRWARGTGYITLWNHLHRAEEALLDLEPVEAVVGEALYDELRLAGSGMASEADLLAKLRHAVAVLNPAARPYLDQQPPSDGVVPELRDGRGGKRARRGPQDGPIAGGDEASAIAQARRVVRTVRCAINTYRDEMWDGLLRARNRIMETVALTALATFLLLALAVAADAPPRAIIAAAAFYLVGAIVGLFNRLYGESRTESAVQDYGLAQARLGLTPLLSGLAAVGGVFVTVVLAVPVAGAVLPSSPEMRPPAPEDIYTLSGFPFGVLIAAVFGLAPQLLIRYLFKEAERHKAGLRSSEPMERAPSSPSPAGAKGH